MLASAPLRMGGAGTSGAHSLSSSVVSLVFLIVSFIFISFIVIMSLRTATMVVVSGMHNVWMMHAVREQWRRRMHLRCSYVFDGSGAGRPTVSQWPVTRGTTSCF